MVKRTEQFEQEFIDAYIEAERIPNHEYRLADHEGEALEPVQQFIRAIENPELDDMWEEVDG